MTCSFTYLPNVHVVMQNFQGSFQQDLPRQLTTWIKDNVALNAGLHALTSHIHLVVARLCDVVVVCGNIRVLESIH